MFNSFFIPNKMLAANYLFGPSASWFMMGLALLAALDLVLKGFSLWRSARRGQNYWFIALMIFNTAGILPAIYLLFFQGKKVAVKTSRKGK